MVAPVRGYFLVMGLLLAFAGAATLFDFRGAGRDWEEDVNRRSEYWRRVLRLPWPHNPYLARAWRPVAGMFGVLLGLLMFVLAAIGAIT